MIWADVYSINDIWRFWFLKYFHSVSISLSLQLYVEIWSLYHRSVQLSTIIICLHHYLILLTIQSDITTSKILLITIVVIWYQGNLSKILHYQSCDWYIAGTYCNYISKHLPRWVDNIIISSQMYTYIYISFSLS